MSGAPLPFLNQLFSGERRIILVDDVFTTGSTVAECTRVLFKAEAAEVCVVTVARAVS